MTVTAAEFFAARLAYQTDVSDVHTALETGKPGFVLVDSRSAESFSDAHLPGAISLPTADIAARTRLVDLAVPVVTYCWGPGCNGATKAAAEFARLGYRVREMLGGIEYWIREGFPVETPHGRRTGSADPLTVPSAGVACSC